MESRKKRKYNLNDGIADNYRQAHENQTLFFVKKQKKLAEEGRINPNTGLKVRMSFPEAIAKLDNLIDKSDPDAQKIPQTIHFYQTGEALKNYLQKDLSQLRTKISVQKLFSNEEWQRLPKKYQEKFGQAYLHELYPHIQDWSWLPLIGFLHDCGKILATKDLGELEQWAVVGDTFVVGAPMPDSAVYAKERFFAHNKDLNMTYDPNSKKFGIYDKHCGFENVYTSGGHDEYLFIVLNRIIHHLPPEALEIVRRHSFYPWHAHQSYQELANDHDWNFLPLLKMFQKSDLYSKDESKIPDIKKLKDYYFGLIQQFIPAREEVGYDLRPAKIRW